MRTLLFLLVLLCTVCIRSNAVTDSFRIHADQPYLHKSEKLQINIFYASDTAFKGDFKITCTRCDSGNDSVYIFKKKINNCKFHQGINKARLDLSSTDENTFCNAKFLEILKITGEVPAGKYRTSITVSKNGHPYSFAYYYTVDSLFGTSSEIRRQINKSIIPRTVLARQHIDVPQSKKDEELSFRTRKIKKIARKNKLNVTFGDGTYTSNVDFFYSNWFIGRYQLRKDRPVEQQIKEQQKEDENPTTGIDDNPGHPSVMYQYQKKNTNKKDNDGVSGEIGLTSNNSNGQDPGSAADANYYELRGRIEMPVNNIPVEVEGYYTTQDIHRNIKSSYVHVHYDIDKMKENLSKSTKDYNSKYTEVRSKDAVRDKFYENSIAKMELEKKKLQGQIPEEKHSAGNNSKDKSALKNAGKMASAYKDSLSSENDEPDSELGDTTTNRNDDTSRIEKAKTKADKGRAKAKDQQKGIEEKEKKVKELDNKIEKYKQLMQQQKNANFFDSAACYDKTKNLYDGENSYKKLAKNAENILPEGKAKTMLAGITKMDAGIFSKADSKYTMSGQMMKGADVGYDVGFCEVGAAAGKTEYAGRDGTLDKYTFYTGKAVFKPVKEQKIKLIYYGYTPDKKIAGDDFFKNSSIAVPGFFQRVNIYSAAYEGAISKYITVNAESAISEKSTNKTNEPRYLTKDKMAEHLDAEGNIPHTSISLKGSYDKTGKGFENNTLPLVLNGTEQYMLACRNDFFRSFLTVGIEFDRLTQTNFSSKSQNTKWGFDIKTNSKRYPNIAVSYKPFTTFHAFYDTLNVPQKPLLGSVTTVKASYLLRKHSRSLRLTFLYNRCISKSDTFNYGTETAQLSGVYSDKKNSITLTLGNSRISGSGQTTSLIPNNVNFITINYSHALTSVCNLLAGQDIGIAPFGLCRYSATAGVAYQFKKTQITSRINLRYGKYKLNEPDKWTQLNSCSVDLMYRFKKKKTIN